MCGAWSPDPAGAISAAVADSVTDHICITNRMLIADSLPVNYFVIHITQNRQLARNLCLLLPIQAGRLTMDQGGMRTGKDPSGFSGVFAVVWVTGVRVLFIYPTVLLY